MSSAPSAGCNAVGVRLGNSDTFTNSGSINVGEFNSGVEVTGRARDGQEALVKLEERTPAVALLDVDMPRISGIEIATMTRWFEDHTVSQHGRYRVVEPTVVVEVAFDVILR